jgi:hypothetical protein
LIWFNNTTNSALVGDGRSWVITLPVATSSAANRSMVPLGSSSWVARCGVVGSRTRRGSEALATEVAKLKLTIKRSRRS